jgi:hypothetical protein
VISLLELSSLQKHPVICSLGFPADKARKEVNKRRRHFNIPKTGFVSQMGNDATKTNPHDVLVDESKQADIEKITIHAGSRNTLMRSARALSRWPRFKNHDLARNRNRAVKLKPSTLK